MAGKGGTEDLKDAKGSECLEQYNPTEANRSDLGRQIKLQVGHR